MVNLFRRLRSVNASADPSLKLNDFIEARPKSHHKKDKYAGRIGLKVAKGEQTFLLMSTHVVTEAITARSRRNVLFGRRRERYEKLADNWNDHVEIWAGDEKAGSVEKSFDTEVDIYHEGFNHDVALIKPFNTALFKDTVSLVENIGWLNHSSWNVLRQKTSPIKILSSTEDHRSAKSMKCSRFSEILVVGQGIFLNQQAAAGTSKDLKEHDLSIRTNLVSRALLYRVGPDFDPPNGYSGVALHPDRTREDGTERPGIVGFQGFV